MSSEKSSRERLLKIALKHMTVKSATIDYPLYHISFRKDLEGVWKPRNPDGEDTGEPNDDVIGEPMFPRISVGDTVVNCFRAIYANVKHYFEEENYPYLDMYVYVPVFKGDEKVLLPKTLTDYKIVHDAHVTNEHCILSNVEFKRHSKIRIKNTKDNKQVLYYLYNNKSLGDGWLLSDDVDVTVLKTY